MPTRLFDLEVEEVSLVDSPAIRRTFAVIKRDNTTQQTEGGKHVEKFLMPIPTAIEVLKGLPLEVDMTFEKRKTLGELCGELWSIFEKGADAPVESIGKVKVADAIAFLTDLKSEVSEDVAPLIDEVIALLQAIGTYGYPKPYGYPRPYGYPHMVVYPYPVPVAAREGKEAQTLTDELKAAISELVVAKVEEVLATKAANDQDALKAELAKAVEGLEIEKKLKEFEDALTTAVNKAVSDLEARLSVLEKALAISQRILPDAGTQKSASASDFWKGVLPF